MKQNLQGNFAAIPRRGRQVLRLSFNSCTRFTGELRAPRRRRCCRWRRPQSKRKDFSKIWNPILEFMHLAYLVAFIILHRKVQEWEFLLLAKSRQSYVKWQKMHDHKVQYKWSGKDAPCATTRQKFIHTWRSTLINHHEERWKIFITVLAKKRRKHLYKLFILLIYLRLIYSVNLFIVSLLFIFIKFL